MGVFVLIFNMIRLVKFKGVDCFEFYFLAGFLSFMIANATNPYLAKFDYMWVMFIPVAMMNDRLLGLRPGLVRRLQNGYK